MQEPEPTNVNSILCKFHIHRFKKYNNGWRRYCTRCLLTQMAGGAWPDRWHNESYPNWEGKDTITYY